MPASARRASSGSFAASRKSPNNTIIQANCHELFVEHTALSAGELSVGPRRSDARRRCRRPNAEDIHLSRRTGDQHDGELIRSSRAYWAFCRREAAEAVAPTSLLLKRKQYDFIIKVLRQVASRQPTLLWVEDAHWLDASSAELLQEIVAAASDVPLLVILTRRSFPNSVALPQPRRDNRAQAAFDGSKSLEVAAGRCRARANCPIRCLNVP